ncbi:MAG TPA: proline--tRNA ligase [Oculatellaceae cyanobacterium]
MRWSQMFIPTLREEPAQVEAVSHRLLLRAGYIKQLTSGVYSLLPLGQRSRLKIAEIIRREMNNIGGQEFLLSALQPLELWDESGRTEIVSDIMFKLKDRKGSPLVLGLTHEEVFTSIARTFLVSYKQLPQIWYQLQTKFRDEARPKGGLLRVREFTMKDSYSFDCDEAGLDDAFQKHYTAYRSIFSRCGLKFRAVEASSGAMGGTASVEFMIDTLAGEDSLCLCQSCNYAANLEKAQSKFEPQASDDQCDELVEFATPGVRTIRELEVFEGGAPADRQIKTLVFVADDKIVLALVQGDQELNESKLQAVLGARALRVATEIEIVDALGAHPGSLGACHVTSGDSEKVTRIVADHRLYRRIDMVTGANKDDVHLRNVSVARDIPAAQFVDLHTVKLNEPCVKCGAPLVMQKGLEIGHIFKLGTRYSETMNASFLSADGSRCPLFMGSYGIGVERLLAAVAELSHDEHGLVWPLAVAPFQVLIVAVNVRDGVQMEAAEQLYSQLKSRNVDVLIDDRDERAGVKFNDGDLIGIPYRVTVGKKITDGKVEFTNRATKERIDVSLTEAVSQLMSACAESVPVA